MGPQHRIKEIRENTRDSSGKKISGITVAKKLGITPQYYYDIEKGDRNLSSEHASQIADFFDVSVDYLLRKTDIPNRSSVTDYLDRESTDLNMQIFSTLKLLTDDEGYFYEDLREEVFHAIVESDIYMAWAFHNSSDHDNYIAQFNDYFANYDTHSEYSHKTSIAEFNTAYNYRTLKVAISKTHDFEARDRLLNLLREVLINNNLKTPDTFANEREFESKLELSDEELVAQFSPELDGEQLSQEEIRDMIAYIRVRRQMKQ